MNGYISLNIQKMVKIDKEEDSDIDSDLELILSSSDFDYLIIIRK